MDRRGFLKRIGQTVAGLMVVPTVIKAKKPGLGKDILSANPALKGSIDLESDWKEYLEDKFTKLKEPPPFESEFNRVQRDKMFIRGMSKVFAKKVLLFESKEQMT